jgi:hypothetical protein
LKNAPLKSAASAACRGSPWLRLLSQRTVADAGLLLLFMGSMALHVLASQSQCNCQSVKLCELDGDNSKLNCPSCTHCCCHRVTIKFTQFIDSNKFLVFRLGVKGSCVWQL